MTQTTLFDATRWDAIHPLGDELLARQIDSIDGLVAWLLERSEFDAVCSEARANLYIQMTCHTDDANAASAWTMYLEDVRAPLEELSAKLDARQMERTDALSLLENRYEVISRDTRVDVELFRQAMCL